MNTKTTQTRPRPAFPAAALLAALAVLAAWLTHPAHARDLTGLRPLTVVSGFDQACAPGTFMAGVKDGMPVCQVAPKGEKGEQGIQGVQGEQGIQGVQGISGSQRYGGEFQVRYTNAGGYVGCTAGNTYLNNNCGCPYGFGQKLLGTFAYPGVSPDVGYLYVCEGW